VVRNGPPWQVRLLHGPVVWEVYRPGSMPGAVQRFVPGKDRWRSAALVRLTREFKSPAGIHCRKALRASSRPITERELVRFQLRQPSYSGQVELAHHDSLIGCSSRVRFPGPLPFCTWAPELQGVVAALAMRIFSRVQYPGGPPSSPG
jgi:hypothetical protein